MCEPAPVSRISHGVIDWPAVAPEPLVTTVVGSYPQPDWLIDRERLGDRLPPRVRALELWRVAEEHLEEAQDDATRLAVQDMELAGVDIVTDGEMRRESYSNRFATALDGVDLDNPGVALDRTGHPNPVPRVMGPIRRTRPVEVRDVELLRSITDRRIKITVPGPFTMTQQAQNDHYSEPRDLALAYAEAVNEELHDLKAAGADVVQIDEPYLQARPEPAREYALEAIDRALAGIEGDTVLHTCFGYAHIVHQRLPGYPFLRELNECAATHLSLEAAQPDLDPEVLRDVSDKVIVLGVLDLGSPEAETPEIVAGRIRKALTVLASGTARRRARLRDEVPPAPARLPEAAGDGGRDRDRPRRARPLMQIGRPGDPVTRIAQGYPDRVEVRGRDLAELMGRMSFTEYFHLLLTGSEPTEDQRFFLDVLLVAIAEHGLMPSNVAARITLAANPGSLEGAVAAGILGAGPVVLGASESCAHLLERANAEVEAGGDATEVARRIAQELHDARRARAGLRPSAAPAGRPAGGADPRARRRERPRRAAPPSRTLARRRRPGGLGQAAADERRDADRGGAARSRVPGELGEVDSDPRAHCEPARAPRRGAAAARWLPPRGDGGRGRPVRARGGTGRLMLEPEVESRPWDEQLAIDDASYREQLAYLFERSPFYKEKLSEAGVESADAAGGLEGIAQLPLTDKPELRATCTDERPLGAHLCADPAELVRIYSTSGTTGTPSFVPLTAGDLDNWVTGSARSYAASGISAGQRIVSTYNAGPFVAGAALASFDRIGLTHIPVGTGNTDRLLRVDRAPPAGGSRPDAVLRRVPRRRGLGPRTRPARVERRARAGRGRARRRRARLPRAARGGLGREGHGGHGHRRHRRLPLGRMRGAGRDASRRARLRPCRADRSRDR